MSYVPGTSLGRLREIIGDTDASDELFDDVYLNDLLSVYNSESQAGMAALRRVILEPRLMRKMFAGYGQINLNNLGNFIRIIEELIKHINESSSTLVEASSSETAFPDEDQTEVGRATDSDGWWDHSTLDNILLDLENRQ